jgi:cytochrome c
MWKLNALLKIKIFLWYLRRGVVLTKNNLAKHNSNNEISCCSCHKNETTNHLFFSVARFALYGPFFN